MKYFNPTTSKKLEEMGLTRRGLVKTAEEFGGHILLDEPHDTLDICEIENAKKLFGEENVMIALIGKGELPVEYEWKLREYIVLSDEERVKYVEDYLKKIKE